MIRALGLIEVNGFVGAVEAADAALKAASVTLLGIEKVTGGIVTVKITGDVGAVKAAVSAGAASADHLGTGIVRTSHVIPRIHEELEKLNLDTRKVNEPVKATEEVEKIEADLKAEPETVIEVKEEAKAEPKTESKTETKEVPKAATKKQATKETSEATKDEKDLGSMKVEELRKLARSLKLDSMTNKQIKFAKKDVLIEAILKFYKDGDN